MVDVLEMLYMSGKIRSCRVKTLQFGFFLQSHCGGDDDATFGLKPAPRMIAPEQAILDRSVGDCLLHSSFKR